MDPVGPHRQRVGGVETQEGQTPKGERALGTVNGWCKKYTAIINDPDHLRTIDTWLLAQSLNVCHEKQNMVLKNTVSTHKEENVILPKHLQLRISSQYPACTHGVFAFRSDTRFCLACLTEHQALSKPSAETEKTPISKWTVSLSTSPKFWKKLSTHSTSQCTVTTEIHQLYEAKFHQLTLIC